jgi:hypothetical protein
MIQPIAYYIGLMMFAAIWSGYPMPANPPVVIQEHLLAKNNTRPWATTDWKKVIHLNDNIKMDDFGKCILTHEYVHYLQMVNGVKEPRNRQEMIYNIEMPAYKIQALCLRMYGLDIDAEDIDYRIKHNPKSLAPKEDWK